MSDNKAAYTGKDYPRHTNGPWGYEDFTSSCQIVTMGQKLVAGVYSRCCNSPEEMRANAKLIAAAPEMLEALRRVDNYFTQPGEDDWIRFCKEALEPVRRAIKLAIEG